MDESESGAACLAIVLSYYGRLVSTEELRARCGVSREGSKASNVSRAASDFGLCERGVREHFVLRKRRGERIDELKVTQILEYGSTPLGERRAQALAGLFELA